MSQHSPKPSSGRENPAQLVGEAAVSRRSFIAAAGAAAAAASLAPKLALAAPTRKSKAETIVAELYSVLSDEQKKTICLPFNDPLRSRINANWAITKPAIGGDFYTAAQRDLIGRVLQAVTSEDGYSRLLKQMSSDSGEEGVAGYHMALFGSPDNDGFEWTMTGRHLTIRADGDTVKNMAFGGPVVYGHGEEDPKENLFHYQTKKANEVFEALNADQRDKALLTKAPPETAVAMQGADAKFPGISVGQLADDQKQLFEEVLKVILAPYRSEDVRRSRGGAQKQWRHGKTASGFLPAG